MDKYKFGRRVQNVRKERGLSTDTVAELCNINAVFYRQIESGVKLPALPNFTVICTKLGASADYLLQDSIELELTNQLDTVVEKIKRLSPNQLNVAEALINTLLQNEQQ